MQNPAANLVQNWPNSIKIALVLIGGCVAAYWSAAMSIAQIVQSANPELALRMVPQHSSALAAQADGLLLKGAKGLDGQAVARLATASIRAQSLNARALRLAAFSADSQGDAQKASTLMALSNRASRRDWGTQLWLIEEAVRQDNVPLALSHYDIALRTRVESHTTLFPVLTQALNQPEVANGIIPYLNRKPEWLYPFLNYAISKGTEPQNVADMLQRTKNLPNSQKFRALQGALIGKMLGASSPGAIESYASSLKGFDPSILKTAAISKKTVGDDLSPATWSGITAANVTGEFLENATGDLELRAYAAAGTRGEVARKLLLLPPGKYLGNVNIASSSIPNKGSIELRLICLESGTI